MLYAATVCEDPVLANRFFFPVQRFMQRMHAVNPC